jgi:hypothetical protein
LTGVEELPPALRDEAIDNLFENKPLQLSVPFNITLPATLHTRILVPDVRREEFQEPPAPLLTGRRDDRRQSPQSYLAQFLR